MDQKLTKAEKITLALVATGTAVVSVGTLVLYGRYLEGCLHMVAGEANKLTEHILAQATK